MDLHPSLTCIVCVVSGPDKPSYEAVLFSFGVGLGVLLASGNHKAEVKRLTELLDMTQADLETLTMELSRRENPSRTNITHPASVSVIPHFIALSHLSESDTTYWVFVWLYFLQT